MRNGWRVAFKYHNKLHGGKCLCLKAQTYSRPDHDHDRNGTDCYLYYIPLCERGWLNSVAKNISQGQVPQNVSTTTAAAQELVNNTITTNCFTLIQLKMNVRQDL